jgi:outer membrane protein OmpA-like peptidoglycan-associated protein
MKRLFSALFYCFLFYFLPNSNAQPAQTGLPYYVVIGAFSQEQYAKDLIAWSKSVGLSAQYKMNDARKLFYVYSMRDMDWMIPVQEAERLRKLYPKLDDTWVYNGLLGNEKITDKPKKDEPLSTGNITNEVTAPKNESSGEPTKNSEPPTGKKFFFSLNSEDGTVLKSPIEIIDVDRGILSAVFHPNEKVLLRPANKTGKLMIRTKVFGYRLKQLDLDYNDPTKTEGAVLDSGIFKVGIKVKPLSKGDIAVMYNIFFFTDAGIMRPDSKYEANALVAMMKEFPNRKIIIHGHTNGNAHGKIKTMNEKKRNFFSLTGSLEGRGSATKLSEERANCLLEYLISNGIDKSRMTTKAWGGDKMIHDKLGVKAKENVRVEIEIVEE